MFLVVPVHAIVELVHVVLGEIWILGIPLIWSCWVGQCCLSWHPLISWDKLTCHPSLWLSMTVPSLHVCWIWHIVICLSCTRKVLCPPGVLLVAKPCPRFATVLLGFDVYVVWLPGCLWSSPSIQKVLWTLLVLGASWSLWGVQQVHWVLFLKLIDELTKFCWAWLMLCLSFALFVSCACSFLVLLSCWVAIFLTVLKWVLAHCIMTGLSSISLMLIASWLIMLLWFSLSSEPTAANK